VRELCDGEFEHCCDVFTTLGITAINKKSAALENHENGDVW